MRNKMIKMATAIWKGPNWYWFLHKESRRDEKDITINQNPLLIGSHDTADHVNVVVYHDDDDDTFHSFDTFDLA